MPASIIVTEIRNGLSSTRSESVIASNANLEAAYVLKHGNANSPELEPMFIILPRLFLSKGKNAFVTAEHTDNIYF